ncbi:MAG: prepilin peptidase [Sphingomicrobium sp.]
MIDVQFTDLLCAAAAVLLLLAAAIDIRTRTIPNWLSLAVALGAPLFWWASGIALYPDVLERVGSAYLLFVFFFGMFCLGAMGGGDVKLAAALALWFAPLTNLAFFIYTSFAGGAVTLATMAHFRRSRGEGKPEVPYGVAIAFAGLVILTQRFLNQFA